MGHGSHPLPRCLCILVPKRDASHPHFVSEKEAEPQRRSLQVHCGLFFHSAQCPGLSNAGEPGYTYEGISGSQGQWGRQKMGMATSGGSKNWYRTKAVAFYLTSP